MKSLGSPSARLDPSPPAAEWPRFLWVGGGAQLVTMLGHTGPFQLIHGPNLAGSSSDEGDSIFP